MWHSCLVTEYYTKGPLLDECYKQVHAHAQLEPVAYTGFKDNSEDSALQVVPDSDFLEFMMEDEASGDAEGPEFPAIPEGPKCPFRCQCHLRVIQCSDLGLKSIPGDIPSDTTLLDLQNNKITEIKENDFKNLKSLHALILVNNKITTIHAKALSPLTKLQRLYLSKNLLKEMPANMPKTLQELRIHENAITKIKKSSFQGISRINGITLGSNPFKSAGIEAEIPKVISLFITRMYTNVDVTVLDPSSMHLCALVFLVYLCISTCPALICLLFFLRRLGLSFNEISSVENGTLANIPHLRELHLDNNALTNIPSGLPDHKYIQVVYLHANKIAAVGTGDFCPPGFNTKKAMYTGISLFSNPVPYWEVQPITFRCVFDRSAIQLGNYRKK
ncbi:Decorin Bone proteoglycan II PG-S2 Precursor [Channa argus]|uniref:Decorin n=1 Tax=Channa argus TaxID=215402 RepID=A0A6G1QRS0_CHAAH|nr:Decorin Bone proteoglycan II PG-S2 Precursor [Channa argus]